MAISRVAFVSDRQITPSRSAQSFLIANVHTEPPVGTLPAAYRLARPPPSPDATVTYCRPLCVYVIAVELTLDPVLNCHSVLPVARSSATNSPESLPVKRRPPP